MLLELNPDEREILAGLIRRELDELGPEIHHTRTERYREDLKARRDLLMHLLDRLFVAQPVGG